MPKDATKTGKDQQADARRERLAAELRANLGKRKDQARARGAAQSPAQSGASVASRHRDAGRSGQS